ncbi:hypothetical protein AQUCO_00600475v1 [Aquilegia coerulea]|uniref:Uncharacterized protein n=1 Tax=Aquilegia coerulea TaxID=218851 RepID=A0A2G5EPT7_AQUCA|nr:hypothetical protein AQUCO_00600475v1 [Aquilegia coerulea]
MINTFLLYEIHEHIHKYAELLTKTLSTSKFIAHFKIITNDCSYYSDLLIGEKYDTIYGFDLDRYDIATSWVQLCKWHYNKFQIAFLYLYSTIELDT